MKKITVVLLSVFIVLTSLQVPVLSKDTKQTEYVTSTKENTTVYVDKDNGRFAIQENHDELNDDRLGTTIFEIEGKVYTYGSSDDALETMFEAPTIDGEGAIQSVWYVKQYQIVQSISFVESDDQKSYGVSIRYDAFENGVPLTNVKAMSIIPITYKDSQTLYFDDTEVKQATTFTDKIPTGFVSSDNDGSIYGQFSSCTSKVQFGSLAQMQSKQFSYATKDDALENAALAVTFEGALTDTEPYISTIVGYTAKKEVKATEKIATQASPTENYQDTFVTKQGDVNDGVDLAGALSGADLVNPLGVERLVRIGSGPVPDYSATRISRTSAPFGFPNTISHLSDNKNLQFYWDVLPGEKTGEVMLVATELFNINQFHDPNNIPAEGLQWSNSDLNTYMNGESEDSFLRNFNASELANMPISHVVTYRGTEKYNGQTIKLYDETDARFYLPYYITGSIEKAIVTNQTAQRHLIGFDSDQKKADEKGSVQYFQSGVVANGAARSRPSSIGGEDNCLMTSEAPYFLRTVQDGKPTVYDFFYQFAPNEDAKKFVNTILPLDPDTHIYFRPITKLNVSNIVDIKSSRLTLTQDNVADIEATVGSLTIDGLKDSTQDILKDGLVLEREFSIQSQLPEGANAATYNLKYKVVDTDENGVRTIVSRGSSNDLTKLTIAPTDLVKDTTYDVYVWLENTSNSRSNEATRPIHFKASLNDSTYDVQVNIDEHTTTESDALEILDLEGQAKISFAPYEVVAFKGAKVKNTDTHKLQLRVKRDGSNIEVPYTYDVKSKTYRFIMPKGNVTIYAEAISKSQRSISILGKENREYLTNATVSTNSVYANDTVTIDARVDHADYYLDTVEVYERDYNFALEKTEETPVNVFTDTHIKSFDEESTLSFTVPEGEKDFIIYVNVKKKPSYRVEIDLADMDYIRSTNSTFELYGNKLIAKDVAPGQRIKLDVQSTKAYRGFTVGQLEGVDAENIEVDSQIQNRNVGYQASIAFTLPAYDKNQKEERTYTLPLYEKKLYESYEIDYLFSDHSIIYDLTEIYVRGKNLGQIKGEDGLDALEDETLKQQIQTIRIGGSSDIEENVSIDPSKAVVTEQGRQLKVALDEETKKEIAKTFDVQDDFGYLYITVGTHTVKYKVYTNEKLRYEPFSIVGITQEGKTHKIVLADSQQDLLEKTSGKELLITLKGSIQFNRETEIYELLEGQTLMNGVITYTAYGDSNITLQQDKDGILLAGESGELSTAGFQFFKSKDRPFSLRLDKGVAYTTDGYDIEGKENIRLDWSGTKGLNQIKKVKVISGTAVELEDIVLLKGKIVFGGKMSIDVPFSSVPLAMVELQQLHMAVENGAMKVKGAIANGSAELSENSIPFMELSASAKANINTFERTYEFEASVDFNVFEFEGELALAPISSGALVPDTLDFYVGGSGIPVIPPNIMELTGGGGGFTGLKDTIDKNYKVYPPIVANIKASMAFFEVLNMKGQINAGPTEFSFDASPSFELGSIKFEPFNKLGGGLYLSEQAMELKYEVDAQIFKDTEFIRGGGKGSIGYDFVKKRPTFSGSLYARLQIPKINLGLFSVGPIKLLDINLGISSDNIHGKFKIIGIGFGVRYSWGNKKVSFFRSLLDNSPVHDQVIYDENHNAVGLMSFGTNVEIVDAQMPFAFMRMPQTEYNYENVRDTEFLTINGTRDQVIVEYFDETSQSYVPYTLHFPRTTAASDTQPYTEEELSYAHVNALDVVSGTEKSMMVNLDGNLSAKWKVRSKDGSSISVTRLNAKPMEEISDFTYANKQVDFTLQNLDNTQSYSVDVYVDKDKNDISDEGIYVGNYEVDSTSIVDGKITGQIAVDLDSFASNLASGEYYVHGVLQGTYTESDNQQAKSVRQTEDGNYEQTNENARSVFSKIVDQTNTITFTNANMPSPVEEFVFENHGSDTFKATWKASSNAKNEAASYEIRVLGEDGNQVYRKEGSVDGSDVALNDAPVIYTIDASASSNDTYEAVLSGLEGGKSYKMQITPFVSVKSDALDKEVSISGTSYISEVKQLRKATYPTLDVQFANATTFNSAADDLTVLSTGTYDLHIQSDQDCSYEVRINDASVINSTTSEENFTTNISHEADTSYAQVVVVATNTHGDSSFYSYISQVDNQAPNLFVDTEDGIITTDEEGNFTVTGTTEAGLFMHMNLATASEQTADAEGNFTLVGCLPENQDEAMITITSRDLAGNSTDAMIQVKRAKEEVTFYTIQATAGQHGSISPSGEVLVEAGMNASFSFSADTDYEIAKVLVDGIDVGVVESYSFTDVNADHTIEVEFKEVEKTPEIKDPEETPKDPEGETPTNPDDKQPEKEVIETLPATKDDKQNESHTSTVQAQDTSQVQWWLLVLGFSMMVWVYTFYRRQRR
ncbi:MULTISPECIES: hypothetical protein [unclassified Breznakia]|uniref:hypothetical protein n=1 Tax=unclassified Breznakia TaxID=2623764 RepID=UPI002474FE87|nr:MULTISPECIES: hypothetical protein [unclassified Breznakia]MDH6365883.1 hypothetical protein [Breznakia sp. PH1-1]MDH6403185.1 hypothetical protein [Breznakia sp. PF1-11]MDH6410894.1 hypothetical protein [Breznakia sp. PFB1-11]MDH6413049.1 hypothetical protein [Breznakia sp. PFB1-14]MDH6415417.1 hypothetical protein [Breznakia sp. PFB1-4]